MLTVARAAVHAAWDVTVGLQSNPRTWDVVEQLLHVPGVRYTDARLACDGRRREILRQGCETARLLAQVRPSAAMIVLPWPDLALGCVLATACPEIPTAVIFQLAPLPLSIGRRVALYRWAQHRREQWVAVCAQNRAAVARSFGVRQSTIRVIYNGVSDTVRSDPTEVEIARRALRAELGLPADARVVLTVGRLHQQKGHTDLLRILPTVLEERPDTFFLWAGNGDLRPELESQIRHDQLERNVRILGHRNDVARLLDASDLFVLPSRFEGHPFALLEAMASGTPAVSSDAGGAAEIMRDEIDGLVHRREDPADLASHLSWALDHPAAMHQMAASARDRSKDFSESYMLRETLALLDELLAL